MTDSEYARYVWRCRRGTREMDLLLQVFLECHFSYLSSAERECFSAFLCETDVDIMSWVMGNSAVKADYIPIIRLLRTVRLAH